MIGKIISLEKHCDSDGCLVVAEQLHREIDFEIKRIYYIYGTRANFTRGKHAHKELKQVLICVHGCCTIKLDDGLGMVEYHLLDDPTKGLVVTHNTWREMFNFSPDCVLLVLASEYYDENDYIRSYDAFLKYAKQGE